MRKLFGTGEPPQQQNLEKKLAFRDEDVDGGAARVRRLAGVVARVPGRRVAQDQLGGRLEAVLGLPGADGDAIARPPSYPSSSFPSSVGVLVVDHLGVVVPEYEP